MTTNQRQHDNPTIETQAIVTNTQKRESTSSTSHVDRKEIETIKCKEPNIEVEESKVNLEEQVNRNTEQGNTIQKDTRKLLKFPLLKIPSSCQKRNMSFNHKDLVETALLKMKTQISPSHGHHQRNNCHTTVFQSALNEEHFSQKSKHERKMSFFKKEFQCSREKKMNVSDPGPPSKCEMIQVLLEKNSASRKSPCCWWVGRVLEKPTWINGLFNYIHGMEWSDNSRVKLIDENESGRKQNQAKSQTKEITPYTIHYQPWFKFPYTVTVIDTLDLETQKALKKIRK